MEYFDSYGLPPTEYEFVRFLQSRAASWRYNGMQCQAVTSDTCGHHCLFFLWHRCHGLTFTEILHLFGPDPDQNDAMVRAFVTKKMPGRVQREHRANMDMNRALLRHPKLSTLKKKKKKRKCRL